MLPHAMGLPNGPYTDSHGIPLLATDAVAGAPRRWPLIGPAAASRQSDAAALWLAAASAHPAPSLDPLQADMEKKGLRDQLEAQAREIQRLQGEMRLSSRATRICLGADCSQ